MFEKLQSETAVKLYFVESATVDQPESDSSSLSDSPAVPGTMALHEVVVEGSVSHAFQYRVASCRLYAAVLN